MNVKVGDTLVIHCYKHNGVIYESSKVAYVIDIKDDYIVLGDENVLITKQDGRRWHQEINAFRHIGTDGWNAQEQWRSCNRATCFASQVFPTLLLPFCSKPYRTGSQ